MQTTPIRRRATFDPQPAASDEMLSRYLHDVAAIPPHQADEEFRTGHALREAEVDQWMALLRRSRPRRAILGAVRGALAESLGAEGAAALLEPLLRSTARKPRELASGLRDLDEGRQLLRAATLALEAAARRASSEPGLAGPRIEKQLRTVQSLGSRAGRLRDQFVRSNLRLVITVARQFRRAQVPLTDLIQEGNLGLIHAVERYDYRRGFRFSTYACWWIRHSILRSLADRERFVRVPIHMLDVGRKIEGARQTLARSLGRDATDEEVSASTRLDQDRVRKLRVQLSQSLYSLEHPIHGDGRTLSDALPDPEALTPISRIEDASVQAEVQRRIERLRPIERDVITSHFGLQGQSELTLRELGDRYQLSRERIRQIQNQALRKIRRYLQRSRAI